MPEQASHNMRVALYARVSTDEQREGQTIDSQIAELDRFARGKGWQITGVYKDNGWSGTILARPELDRLRDDGSKGLFTIALINDVDRLARDVSHLGIVKRDLQRHGVQVVFRKLPSEQSPTHNLMVNILGSFAEFERELILDRTRRGRRHKVEVRGQFVGGLAPYGFRYVPKDQSANKEGYLEIIPEEATIVRQMFDWVDKQGLSGGKVAQLLSRMKVAPRKKGDRWGKSSVLRILRSETYAGVWHYNKHECCEPMHPARAGRYRKSLKSSVKLRPRSEWLPLILPEELRLIDRDQWKRVQDQLSRNITFSPRNSKHQYLLKGLVKCGGCGARYVGDPNHGRYYYRCHARCKQNPTVRDSVLDGIVWGAVEEAVLNPELLAENIKTVVTKQLAVAKELRTEETEIEHALSAIQPEENRILEVYRTGVITPEQLGQQLEQINARKSALKARATYISRTNGANPAPASKRSVLNWCQSAAQGLQQLDPKDRQRFLRLLISDIVFKGSLVTIRGVIPVSTSRNGDELDSENRTAAITAHRGDRNSVIPDDGIVDTAPDQRGRNSVVSDDSIGDIVPDRSAPNTVCGVTFELVRPVPQRPPTLREQLDDFFIRSLVQRYPSLTL